MVRSAASLLLGACLALTVRAETLEGRVIAIQDGDTLTVLDAQHVEHRIRLMGIDAPEKRQPWGDQSKAHLGRLTFGQTVTVDWRKRDRYQRIVGKVLTSDGADACLAQVTAGLAWHYTKYQREQTPEDREAYAAAEATARASGAGLWQDTHPIPPWEWRHPPR